MSGRRRQRLRRLYRKGVDPMGVMDSRRPGPRMPPLAGPHDRRRRRRRRRRSSPAGPRRLDPPPRPRRRQWSHDPYMRRRPGMRPRGLMSRKDGMRRLESEKSVYHSRGPEGAKRRQSGRGPVPTAQRALPL